ncbi:MAG: PHB depolymerase family esterase [Bacteroidia bacterium]
MKLKTYITLLFICCGIFYLNAQAQVLGFGSNPGNLNMYKYVPSGITGPAPLVIALHGCTETALEYAHETGWDKLADRHLFYVIYPEQVIANNSSLCFNWFDTTDVNRNMGEALSIKQMRDYMVANYDIDTTRIFVTGLSAGAAMTVAMLAAYPELFHKGAEMSGLPYKAATSVLTTTYAEDGLVTNIPSQWRALVRAQNPTYTGPFPKLAIFHGTADFVVNINNATELIKQWTNLNHADQIVDSTYNSFQGNANVEQTIYNDSSNNPVVYYYKITGMPHGIAIDTGSCPRQGGAIATYSIEEHKFHSTYWAADFFGILKQPYIITGSILVNQYAANIVYSVPNTIGSTYNWTVPTHAQIVGGQGTNSITVNFDTISGNVSVTETTAAGCINDEASLYVLVNSTNGVVNIAKQNGKIVFCSADNSLLMTNFNLSELKSIVIYNSVGEKMSVSYNVIGNKIFLKNKFSTGIYFADLIGEFGQGNCKMLVLPTQ